MVSSLFRDYAGLADLTQRVATAQNTADNAVNIATAALAAAANANYAITTRSITYWIPGGTVFGQIGEAALVTTGTYSIQRPSTGNALSARTRGRLTSSAAANSSVLLRNGGVGLVRRGNGVAEGGFVFRGKFGTETAVANQKAFVGLYDFTTNSDIGNGSPVTSKANVFGIGYETGDTNWFIIHNDSSGNASKTSLGASFPVDAVSLLEVRFDCLPNGTEINYSVLRQNDGALAEGTIDTDIPDNTTNITPYCWANNGGTASAVQLAVCMISVESYT